MRKKATVWALALAMSVQMLAVSGVSAADFSSGETGSVFSENTETDSGNSVPVTEETPTDNSAGSSVEEEQTETGSDLPEEAEPTEDVEIFGSSEVIPDESDEFSGKDSLEVLGDPEGAAASEIPEEERKDLSACTCLLYTSPSPRDRG